MGFRVDFKPGNPQPPSRISKKYAVNSSCPGSHPGFSYPSMKGNFLKPATFLLLISLPMVSFSCKKPTILVARMETSMGTMVIELFEEETPLTVDNFVGLAEGTKTWKTPSGEERSEPFYDGLIFHRVIKDFMIQGGCPQGTGTGGRDTSFGMNAMPARLLRWKG